MNHMRERNKEDESSEGKDHDEEMERRGKD